MKLQTAEVLKICRPIYCFPAPCSWIVTSQLVLAGPGGGLKEHLPPRGQQQSVLSLQKRCSLQKK